jgi:hypothetical protein
MAAYSDTLKEYHKGRIRDVMILKPGVSVEGIRRVLEMSQDAPLTLDHRYISKLVQKIRDERETRMDRVRINARLAEMQDRYEAVTEQMWKILLDTSLNEVRGGIGARVQAAKTILEQEEKLLNAQMEAGVFERKIGTLAIDHQHTYVLPDEIRLPILQAFKNYGIIRNPTYTVLPAQPAGGDHHGGSTSASS